MPGHIGVYIGDGLAVECTPKWDNKVQITAVANIGKKAGYNSRKWTKHGKLPYVEYVVEAPAVKPSTESTKPSNEVVYTVKRGDTLSAIARKYGTTYKVLAAYNGISNPNIIRVGQKIKIPGTSAPTATKSVDEVAREVIQGKWGNGATRRARLTAAGYNYATVQARVNALLSK